MAECCCENHGADHVHDMTELDHDTDEKPVVIDPGESRIPQHHDGFDANFVNFTPENKGIRDAYIAYARADEREVEKDPALSNCVLTGADFTLGRYVKSESGEEEFVPDQNGDEVQIGRRYSSKFERIRRITGYLVGTVDRWNSAKQHELHDRRKHGLAHEATIGQV